jgi:Lipocalin-like domain
MMAPTQTTQATSPMRSQAGNENVTGTWKLVSCFMEDVETKEQRAVWGKRPNGYLTLTAGGHWIVVQTAEGRKVPQTDEDRGAAFRSMLAYCGKYRIEDCKIVIKVDIAWDESWTGTEQLRFFSIENDRLHIEAVPQRYANFGDSVMRAILIWERVE